MKGGEIRGRMSVYWLLQNGCAPCSWLFVGNSQNSDSAVNFKALRPHCRSVRTITFRSYAVWFQSKRQFRPVDSYIVVTTKVFQLRG